MIFELQQDKIIIPIDYSRFVHLLKSRNLKPYTVHVSFSGGRVYPLQFPTAIRMAITSSLNTRFVACYIWADKKRIYVQSSLFKVRYFLLRNLLSMHGKTARFLRYNLATGWVMETNYDGSEEEQIFYDTVREYVVSIEQSFTIFLILWCTNLAQTLKVSKRVMITNRLVMKICIAN